MLLMTSFFWNVPHNRRFGGTVILPSSG